MRALSIRQPFVELILRGVKTAEVRTRPTRVIGERFWIYAAKGGATERRRGRRGCGRRTCCEQGARQITTCSAAAAKRGCSSGMWWRSSQARLPRSNTKYSTRWLENRTCG